MAGKIPFCMPFSLLKINFKFKKFIPLENIFIKKSMKIMLIIAKLTNKIIFKKKSLNLKFFPYIVELFLFKTINALPFKFTINFYNNILYV